MIRRWRDRWRLGRKPGRAELSSRLATVIRERNKLAAQVVETQYALEQRERTLGEEGRLRSEALLRAENLQRELAHEQSLVDRVRAVLADGGLSEGQANARIRQVLIEGGGDG